MNVIEHCIKSINSMQKIPKQFCTIFLVKKLYILNDTMKVTF